MKISAFKTLVTAIVFCLGSTLMANNITLSNLTLTGKNTTDHFTLVQFDISWENSWRTSTTPFNWDAAWVFVKYRKTGEEWQHAWLNESGHTAPAGSVIMPGLLTPGTAFNASTNPCMGAFIYRSADGAASAFTQTSVQLRWNYGANGVTDADNIEIQVFAIEMVYVPQGSFYVGDGTTTDVSGQFTAHNTTGNFQITSELVPATLGGTTAGNLGNNNIAGMVYVDDFNNTQIRSLPADFPKGYNAFYCMKYEISQQQYVDFLNTLTQAQAISRKFNKPVPNNFRYEITGSEVGTYSTTTPWLACNFLSWEDVAAYLDWSGLRPMSELEYEKASRGTGAAVANEYAWGSTAITQNTGITNAGLINETSTNSGNCSFGSHVSIQGPMRVGAFATATTTRIQSGASFCGIMDLSGNLKERTMTLGGVDGRMFTGLHGNGTLSVAGTADVENWLSDGAGFRGGDWSSVTTLARVSARSDANNTDFMRGNNYGGRGVRTQPLPQLTTVEITSITHDSATSGGNVTSDAGSIITARGVCWSTTTGPTIALATKTIDGSGTGTFTSIISGLTENTLYYVRAYATNNAGTAYGNEVSFTTTTATFVCGSSITKNHLASGGVAPVDKTVTYGTVTNIPGETTKCWITSNLGADHQAASVDDATEASAGWYWQFNRKQGYKHDGTTRTPSSTWDATNDNLSATWQAAKDPCTLELGAGWHIPTSTEWTNVDASGNWTTWNDPFDSDLKLHAAGYLRQYTGTVNDRGYYGWYWSNTQYSATYGRYLLFADWGSNMDKTEKANGFSVRCVKDLLPTLTTTDASIITATTATCGGTITDQGGNEVTARGVCWSTSANPTTALVSKTNDGMGTGTFTSALTGLVPTTLYHVRAYCTNTDGTAYGEDKTFTTAAFVCGSSSLSINHTASGGVAPVDKTITYGTVTNIPGETTKCWITSNLGADHQAASVDDATEASAGWYWQFNRKQGFKHDGTTRTPNTAWVSNISETSDWTPTNDPCALELGAGWRIPTNAEWTAVDASENWTNWNGPWTSGLKMHAAGYLLRSVGSLSNRGSYGYYWSSSQYGASIGWYLYFGSDHSYMNYSMKALGLSLRCLRD